MLDILPNRYERDLVKYFSQFPNKKDVKYFVCDMNPHFREVAKTCFPNAKIVADRYHVVRQVYWAMERVRKNEQEKMSDRFRKYFKRSRYLLMKPTEELAEEEMNRLGKQKLADWLLAVEVMDIPEFYSCTNTGFTRSSTPWLLVKRLH